MNAKQMPSQYWGTGPELSAIRDTMDAAKANLMFLLLARRIHGLRFDYRKTDFRSLYHDLVVTLDGVDHTIRAVDHLMSEDGLERTIL